MRTERQAGARINEMSSYTGYFQNRHYMKLSIIRDLLIYFRPSEPPASHTNNISWSSIFFAIFFQIFHNSILKTEGKKGNNDKYAVQVQQILSGRYHSRKHFKKGKKPIMIVLTNYSYNSLLLRSPPKIIYQLTITIVFLFQLLIMSYDDTYIIT